MKTQKTIFKLLFCLSLLIMMNMAKAQTTCSSAITLSANDMYDCSNVYTLNDTIVWFKFTADTTDYRWSVASFPAADSMISHIKKIDVYSGSGCGILTNIFSQNYTYRDSVITSTDIITNLTLFDDYYIRIENYGNYNNCSICPGNSSELTLCLSRNLFLLNHCPTGCPFNIENNLIANWDFEQVNLNCSPGNDPVNTAIRNAMPFCPAATPCGECWQAAWGTPQLEPGVNIAAVGRTARMWSWRDNNANEVEAGEAIQQHVNVQANRIYYYSFRTFYDPASNANINPGPTLYLSLLDDPIINGCAQPITFLDDNNYIIAGEQNIRIEANFMNMNWTIIDGCFNFPTIGNDPTLLFYHRLDQVQPNNNAFQAWIQIDDVLIIPLSEPMADITLDCLEPITIGPECPIINPNVTYEWFIGTTPVGTGANITVSPTTTTTYTLVVTGPGVCSESQDITVFVNGTLDCFTINKTVEPASTYAGNSVLFSIEICNNNSIAFDVELNDILPADFSVNCSNDNNPWVNTQISVAPGCTTLFLAGCFTHLGNKCNEIEMIANGNLYTDDACIDVLVLCPMSISGIGGCDVNDPITVNLNIHAPVTDLLGFNIRLYYPDFIEPVSFSPLTGTLPWSGSFPFVTPVLTNITYPGGGWYYYIDIPVSYSPPGTVVPPPFVLASFDFHIISTPPAGLNFFDLFVVNPITSILNQTELITQTGNLSFWTQPQNLLLIDCPNISEPDAGFTVHVEPCTGEVTVTANYTGPNVIHKWEFGDNRTTPVLGSNPYTYDYFAPITSGTNGPINPPIPPAPPGFYTITHTVIEGNVASTHTISVPIFNSCCSAISDLHVIGNQNITGLGWISPVSNMSIYVDGSLTIDQNFNFINCTFYMEPASEIVVVPGNSLTFDQTTAEACSNMWKGIKTDTDVLVNLTNSKIMDAERGITAVNGSNVTSDGTEFMNNVVGIYVPQNFSGNGNVINVRNSTFHQVGSLKQGYSGQPAFGTMAKAGMELFNWTGVVGSAAFGSNIFQNMHTGIISFGSNIRVANTKFRSIHNDNSYGQYFGGSAIYSRFNTTYTALDLVAVNSGNTVDDCDYGVYTLRTDLRVTGIIMNDVLTGIYSEGCVTPYSSIVVQNFIYARDYGINWKFNDGSTSMRAQENVIHMSGNKFGMGVNLEEVNIGNNGNYNISFNSDISLFEVQYGIRARGVNRAVITYNTINQISNGNYPTTMGIAQYACNRSIINCNTVNTNYVLSPSYGLYTEISTNSDIVCNTTNNQSTGIFFGGDCDILNNFAGNTMNACAQGLHLNNTSRIGGQSHRGNLWTNAPGVLDAQNTNPLFLNSNFRVHTLSGTVYHPVVSPAGWFGQTLGSPFSCSSSQACNAWISGGDGDEDKLRSVAKDSSISVDYSDETLNMAQQNLYEYLIIEDSLLNNDSIFSNFYASNETGAIGMLFTVKDKLEIISNYDSTYSALIVAANSLLKMKTDSVFLLDSICVADITLNFTLEREGLITDIIVLGQTIENLYLQRKSVVEGDIDAARNINAVVIPYELPETNEKTVNEYFILFEKYGKDTLSGYYNDILYIASQCPYAGGKSVHRARTFISLFNDTIEYDDALICIQQGIYRTGNGSNQQVKFELKPNPANNFVELILSKDAKGICNVSVRNALGSVEKTEVFNCDKPSHIISTNNLNPGVYFVGISFDSSNMEYRKLIINR